MRSRLIRHIMCATGQRITARKHCMDINTSGSPVPVKMRSGADATDAKGSHPNNVPSYQGYRVSGRRASESSVVMASRIW